MKTTTMSLTVERSALFSGDKRHRYHLRRWWTDSRRPLLVAVMLNPSTADDQTDDATTRFMMNRARDWNYGAYSAVNLFAFRGTQPLSLLTIPDPVGVRNDDAIVSECRKADRIVVAWGSVASSHTRLSARVWEVRRLLRSFDLYCFGTNADGNPRFPRAIRADCQPILWKGKT